MTLIKSKKDWDAYLKAAGGKTVIVLFYDQRSEPFLEEFQKLAGNFPSVKTAQIDADGELQGEVVVEFMVLAVPTFIIYKGGKEKERMQGGDTKSIQKLFEKYK